MTPTCETIVYVNDDGGMRFAYAKTQYRSHKNILPYIIYVRAASFKGIRIKKTKNETESSAYRTRTVQSLKITYLLFVDSEKFFEEIDYLLEESFESVDFFLYFFFCNFSDCSGNRSGSNLGFG